VLGIRFLMQIVSGMLPSSGEGGVAFFAHIGGFVAGMALVPFFKKPNVKLFQASRSRPFEVERRRGPWG
jgi:membrane associated rhomboid family serine protease